MSNINFKINFDVNKSGLNSAKKELEQIQKALEERKKINVDDASVNDALAKVKQLKQAMDSAIDTDTGILNVKKLNSELRKLGTPLDEIQKSFSKVGVTGTSVFNNIQREASQTHIELKKNKTALSEMADTLAQTARWSVASGAINMLSGSVQRAFGFVKRLDESLTQIKIVTGKSAGEMQVFAKEANKAAKELGRTTTEYTDASLIFFQQGKNAEEVRSLTEATLAGANVTGMDAAQTAELLTAVMNGYQLEATKALEVTDKLAAVGAATGSDFEEMAEAMSKVSSQANNAGVDIDQLAGMLSTVATVTREDASIIGTSFKTILGRLGDIKLGKGAEGWDTGQVEAALNNVGMSILDQEGKMKEAGVIIDELGSKWTLMTKEAQIGVAKQIAGLEQYNRLVALMDNWSMYQDAYNVSLNSAGATMEQNVTRMDSMESKLNGLTSEFERLYQSLSDEETFKDIIDFLAGAVGGVANLVDALGGLKGVVSTIVPIAMTLFSDKIGGMISSGIIKIQTVTKSVGELGKKVKDLATGKGFTRNGGYNEEERASLNEANTIEDSDVRKSSVETIKLRSDLRKKEQSVAKHLTEEEIKSFKISKDKAQAAQEELNLLVRKRKEEKAAAAERLKAKADEIGEENINRKFFEKDQALLENRHAKEQEQLDKVKRLQKEIGDLSYDQIENIQLGNKLQGENVIHDKNKLKFLQNILQDTRLLNELGVESIDNYSDIDEYNEAIIEAFMKQKQRVSDTNDELEETKRILEDINVASNESKPSQREKDLKDTVSRERGNADKLGKKAENKGKFSKAVKGIGVGLSVVSAAAGPLQTLGDEAASTEEKVNSLSGAVGSVGIALMMTGNPYAVAAGAILEVGAAAIKAANYFNPLNKAIRDNKKVLEEQNAVIGESQQRIKDLGATKDSFNKAKTMSVNGINADDKESMEEFVRLQNEIARTAPEMVSYYDEQGNAVIDFNKDLKDLIETQKEYQRNAQGAKRSNYAGFSKEYEADIEKQKKQVEKNQRILDSMKNSKDGTHTEKGILGFEKTYSSKDIGKLSAEIDAANRSIQDTKKNVQENIINPIYAGSEAYTQLTDEQKKYMRGLMNADIIMSNMDKPESINRYASTIEKYMNSYVDINKGALDQINDIKAKMEHLEVGGLTSEEQKEYDALKEKLAEVNEEIKPVNENFDKLSKASQDSVLAMLSIVDVDKERFKSAIDEMTNYYQEKENLMKGPMDVSQFNDIVGREDFNAEETEAQLRQPFEERESAIREEMAGLEDNRAGNQVGIVTEEQVENELRYRDLMSELNGIIDEYSNIRADVVTQSLEEERVQDELNEKYWEHIETMAETVEGYNQLNEALEESKEKQGDAAGLMTELNEALAEGGNTEGLEKYVDSFDGLGEALKLGGEEGKAALRALSDEYKKLAQQQGKMYAKLRGNDTTYYKEFLKRNKNQSKLMFVEYGIRADDYKTYNELEEAIAKATRKGKKKVLDQETRDKILNGNQQIQAAYGVADEEINASAESGNKQINNSAITARDVVNNMGEMKNAGVSTWDRIRYAAAVVADKIVGAWRTAKNAVIDMWNGVMDWLANKLHWIGGILPGKLGNMISGWGDKVESWKGDLSDENTTENTDKVLQDITDKYTGDEEDLDLDYGSGELDNKTGGGTGLSGIGNNGDEGDLGGGLSGNKDKGDKGSKDKEEKEVEDMEWEKDIYHDINNEIERKSQLLDRLQKQQDKLYGKELLDNLNKQKTALEQQQKLLERKLQMQKDDAKAQADALRAQGVIIDSSTGMIQNYNEIIAARVAAANALSGEAKEQAIESANAFIEALNKYEEMVMNTIIETQNAIQDSIDAQREKYLEIFDYKINFQIELSEDFQKALDFQKEINDEFEDTSENIDRTSKQLVDMMEKIGNLEAQYNKVMNDASLTDKERIEMMEKLSEQLKEAVKNAKKLDEEMTKLFKDGLKKGTDEIDKQVKAYESMSKEIKHMEQMMKLLGKGEDFKGLLDLQKAEYETISGRLGYLTKERAALEEVKKGLEASGMKGSKEWEAIDEAIKKTTTDIDKLTQDAIKNLQDQFKTTADEIMDSLDKKLTSGMGLDKIKNDLKKRREDDKKYLDTQEKLLAITKLQSKIQKEIDSTDDPAKKAKLQKFMDKELKRLREKDKLTKYDVDRANKLYEIAQKQMALDDLKNAKDTMRLVRDSQGNWVYEFTEDLNAIEKAKNDLSASMEDLYEFDKKNLQSVQDEMIKTQEEYYKEVEQILKNHMAGKYATNEEFQQALTEAEERYTSNITDINDRYHEAQINMTESTLGVLLDAYTNNSDALNDLSEEQKQAIKDLKESGIEDFEDLRDKVADVVNGTADDSLKNQISSAIGEAKENWNTDLTDMISKVVGNEDSLKEATTGAIDEIKKAWEEYQKKVEGVTKDTGNSYDDMKNRIDAINKATQDLNGQTDTAIDKFKKEMEAIAEVTKAFQKQREEIEKNIKAYGDLIGKIDAAIKKKKEEASGVTTSGGNGGSGSGGSGSGSGGGNSSPPPSKPSGPQGNGIPEKGDVVTFTTGTYKTDAWGTSPSGSYLRGISGGVQIDRVYKGNGSTYNYHIKGAGQYAKNYSDLGWVSQSQITGFDTGGYTGVWGKEGRMAFLHEKEIVLNKEDTKNILDTVKAVRGDKTSNSLVHITNAILETSIRTLDTIRNAVGSMVSTPTIQPRQEENMEQVVNINADFSGVRSADEIEKAFENMANMASQYIHRR